MTSRALNLMVGASLKIEPSNGNACYLVELIGYVTDKSLMVTPAFSEGEGMSLAVGDEIAVRYLGSDMSYAFYSKVIQVNDKPYPYLHLEYPCGVQGLSTRRVARVPLQGPVMRLNINDGAKQLSVVMADISTYGARLISESRLGDCGERFVIEMPDVSVANHASLSLTCIIRHVHAQHPNVDETSTTFHHGVEFDHLEEAAQLFIGRFIQDSVTRISVR